MAEYLPEIAQTLIALFVVAVFGISSNILFNGFNETSRRIRELTQGGAK